MHGCGKLLSLHVRWNAWSYTHTHAHVHVHMHIQECCWNPRKVCNWVKNYCVNTTFPVLTLHYHSTIITGGSCRTRNASMHTQGTSFANAGRPQTIKKKNYRSPYPSPIPCHGAQRTASSLENRRVNTGLVYITDIRRKMGSAFTHIVLMAWPAFLWCLNEGGVGPERGVFQGLHSRSKVWAMRLLEPEVLYHLLWARGGLRGEAEAEGVSPVPPITNNTRQGGHPGGEASRSQAVFLSYAGSSAFREGVWSCVSVWGDAAWLLGAGICRAAGKEIWLTLY